MQRNDDQKRRLRSRNLALFAALAALAALFYALSYVGFGGGD